MHEVIVYHIVISTSNHHGCQTYIGMVMFDNVCCMCFGNFHESVFFLDFIITFC